jgi:type I restriction enzyme M protein
MTSTTQRAELQAKIWKIANDVRGSVDGWDFKQFVLGTLFYRFISENFTNYIEGGDDIAIRNDWRKSHKFAQKTYV